MLVAVHIKAQDTLYLNDAIRIAMERNHDIRVVNNVATISKNNATRGNAGMLPRLDVAAGVTYNINSTDIEFSSGIPPTSENGAETQSYNASLNLAYTVFDGLGNIYNYRKLMATAGLSKLQAQLTIEATLIQVLNFYYNMGRAQQQYEVAKKALSVSKERRRRAEVQSEFGRASKLEVLNAEVDYNTDSINMVNAALTIETARYNLNYLLGEESTRSYIASMLVNIDETMQLAELRQLAKQNNVAIKISQANLNLSELDLKLVKASQLPRLDLRASYGFNQANNEVGIVLKQQNLGFSGSLSMSFNIFDGHRKQTQHENTLLSIENNREEVENAKDQVERDIQNAFATYKNRLDLLAIAEKNLSAAKRNFERTQELYRLGQTNSTQFRTAQLNLIRTQSNIIDAKFAAKLAEIQLIYLTGQLIATPQ